MEQNYTGAGLDMFGADDAVDTTSSVGRAFEGRQVYSVNHPAYIAFSRMVEEELMKLAERDDVKRSNSRSLVITSALTSEEVAHVVEVFPEFMPVVIPMNKPVHQLWTALRGAANEWCSVVTQKYSEDVVHYAGSSLSAMLRKSRKVHVEIDRGDPVSVQLLHSERVDCHRLFQDYATVQAVHGVVLPRSEYDDYLRGRAYSGCHSPATCTHQAEAMCVDLSVMAMSPVQVAVAMLQHGASVCHGFFPYHPGFLVQQSGELPGTGVGYVRNDAGIRLLYPEGVAGVSDIPKSTLACWLASHTFQVGTSGGKWFQLELLKNRGPFMFFRIVSVPEPKSRVSIQHALDMPGVEDYTLVKSWKLKDGYAGDVTVASAWIPYSFLVRSRVERRVREFAMQLSPENFSRYAVKKQLRVVNNRWVVSGTTVNVTPPMKPDEIEALATSIYAKAFVDRYESSKLSGLMMEKLKKVVKLRSASYAERLAAVASAVFCSYVGSIVGKVDDWIRDLCDRIAGFFSGGVSKMDVAVLSAPTYVLLSSAAGGWRDMWTAHGETLYGAVNHGFVAPVVESGMAGSLLTVLKRYRPGRGSGSLRRSSTGVDPDLSAVVRVVTDYVDTRVTSGEGRPDLVGAVSALNDVGSASASRYVLEYETAERTAGELVQKFRMADDPDPVNSLNQLYLAVLPSVANQRLEFDTFSLSLDPQDRALSAPYMRMSTAMGTIPRPRSYYASKLKALNVPKRQNVAQELLTAVAARNLNAPVVSRAQDEASMVLEVWENFLDQCCVSDCRAKLAQFRSDPVALAEDALNDWATQAKPGAVDRVIQELESNSRSLGQMPVNEYVAMLKADVKPTLSVKPVSEVTAPQVIVYHEKALSAMYSSMFRVLVRRFLSLLKPNIHVNLLKDTVDIEKFVTANHPFGNLALKYLENDFSKYDKSQSRFVFALEEYVFRELGLNEEMLERWVGGHVECTIRSVAVGLTLTTMYQRKSGDATTAFGNVVLNVLSVFYAYKGTKVVWAVFMGDDSIVCASEVAGDKEAVEVLAEVFNLSAKYFITDAPYFASNFILLDSGRLKAYMVPDPVKRVERLSMHVSADDPQWDERFESFRSAMGVFRQPEVALLMAKSVPQRYEVPDGLVAGSVSALGTLCADRVKFRGMWEDSATVLEA